MELKSDTRDKVANLFRCLTFLIGIIYIADEILQIYLVKTNYWQHDRKFFHLLWNSEFETYSLHLLSFSIICWETFGTNCYLYISCTRFLLYIYPLRCRPKSRWNAIVLDDLCSFELQRVYVDIWGAHWKERYYGKWRNFRVWDNGWVILWGDKEWF